MKNSVWLITAKNSGIQNPEEWLKYYAYRDCLWLIAS